MIRHTKHDAPELEDHERQPCEVWTRVMGYYRPVSQFNHGKKSEHSYEYCDQYKCGVNNPLHCIHTVTILFINFLVHVSIIGRI